MINIAICDDVPEQCRYIRSCAEAWGKQRGEMVACKEYTSAFSFIDAMECGVIVDVALLDICMPGILGTDIAREMRLRNIPAEIIFLTTSEEFAIQAFSVSATDYLVKPFAAEKFCHAMDKAVQHIQDRGSRKIVFRLVGRGVQIEEIRSIVYIESRGHILQIHLEKRKMLETRQSLQVLEQQLSQLAPGQFFSPAKGYLVNLEYVHIVKTEYLEADGLVVPIAKRRGKAFQEAFFAWTFRQDLT